jgi:hypothetical protein
MKHSLALLLLWACIPASAAPSHAGDTPPAFQRIESLVGEWQGTLPSGKPIRITYEKINGGAVLERYRSTDPMWWNMSSAYHLDNDRIVMTHYCSWGNHPRMIAFVDDTPVGRLDFRFLDMAENEPSNGYMRNMTFEFEDENHFKHHWTWRKNGKETPLTLTVERVR